jgi:ophiobolin F synthase
MFLEDKAAGTDVLANLNRFVQAAMLFGMGIQLTEDDERSLKQVVEPAYAALGLANDFFSFDKEYAEHLKQAKMNEQDQAPITNCVWLCMGWHNLSAEEAKGVVRDETIRQEQEFAARKQAFIRSQQCTSRTQKCLDGLSQVLIGNIVWSLRCPRYYPELRYDANAAVENQVLALSHPRCQDLQAACSEASCMTSLSLGGKAGADGIDTPMQSNPSTPQETDVSSGELGNPAKAIIPSHPVLRSQSVLPDDLVRAPFDWCASAPSKQFRSSLIDALNIWTRVQLRSLQTIKDIGSQLHNASLLLDVRRGRPAAYTVYGVAATINSANFAILEASSQLQNLDSRSSVIFHERMRQLYIGQSYDLRWTRHKSCPSLGEYIQVIDGKTGGLLQLLVGLMLSNTGHTISSCQGSCLEELITLIGRLFQIRDDYQNLRSFEYENMKGFAEDLDEGKYSYPMVVALSEENTSKSVIESILAGHEPSIGLSRALKLAIRGEMEACGAFAETLRAIKELEAEIFRIIDAVEEIFEQKNWALRWLVKSMQV